MSASNANPVDWKQRFVADVKRDKKKAAIMAALTVAAVVVVGRVLLKQSSPKPARAVSAAPDSSGSTSGSPGAGPVVAALTGGAVRDRRARRDEYLATMDRRIERDLFKPNLEYFPLATGSSRVTVEAGTTGLGWFDEVRLYVVEQQRAQDRRLAHIQTVRAQAGALSLTSTMVGTAAVINGRVVRVGDLIGGFEVVEVGASSCTLVQGQVRVKLHMKMK